jgi:hypothetical protein
VEPLRESVASMETLLREWFEGLGGSPSVRELEERFYVRRKLMRWVEAGGGGGGLAGGGGGSAGPFGPVA